MTRKARSTQSSSAAAKLISKINKFTRNAINSSPVVVEANGKETRQLSLTSYDAADENYALTPKQKQQIQRNEYLESLTKEQLKSEAKRRGQKTAGTKTELVFLHTSILSVHFLVLVNYQLLLVLICFSLTKLVFLVFRYFSKFSFGKNLNQPF